jgi:hypothetical protein
MFRDSKYLHLELHAAPCFPHRTYNHAYRIKRIAMDRDHKIQHIRYGSFGVDYGNGHLRPHFAMDSIASTHPVCQFHTQPPCLYSCVVLEQI